MREMTSTGAAVRAGSMMPLRCRCSAMRVCQKACCARSAALGSNTPCRLSEAMTQSRPCRGAVPPVVHVRGQGGEHVVGQMLAADGARDRASLGMQLHARAALLLAVVLGPQSLKLRRIVLLCGVSGRWECVDGASKGAARLAATCAARQGGWK